MLTCHHSVSCINAAFVLYSFSVCLSFKRSIFKEEEELSLCKVSLPGDSVPAEGDEGGEESPKHGQPGWKL